MKTSISKLCYLLSFRKQRFQDTNMALMQKWHVFLRPVTQSLTVQREIVNISRGRIVAHYPKTCCCKIVHVQHRIFQTSARISAAPFLGPLLIKLSSGVTRFAAVLAGRYLRNRWKKLSPKERSRITRHFFMNRVRIAFTCSLGTCTVLSYYLWNLEEVPLTSRRRFRVISDLQLKEIVGHQAADILELYSEAVLSSSSYQHMRVFRVVNNLLVANRKLISKKSLNWQINVLDSEDVNAFVLPTGDIFVMTGMLSLLKSDDELAGILGHEIAHVLLDHTAEQLSFNGFFSIFTLVLIASLWAVVPTDALAIAMHWLQDQLQKILIHMPYSRKLEREADQVGLMLAARSCYDVRRVVKFWERMSSEDKNAMQSINWLSTHPTHSNRAVWLAEHVPGALSIRELSNCPRLVV